MWESNIFVIGVAKKKKEKKKKKEANELIMTQPIWHNARF